MFENLRRGRQARNFTTNVRKIVDLKSSSEQILSKNWRWVLLKGLTFRMQVNIHFLKWSKVTVTGYDETTVTTMYEWQAYETHRCFCFIFNQATMALIFFAASRAGVTQCSGGEHCVTPNDFEGDHEGTRTKVFMIPGHVYVHQIFYEASSLIF